MYNFQSCILVIWDRGDHNVPGTHFLPDQTTIISPWMDLCSRNSDQNSVNIGIFNILRRITIEENAPPVCLWFDCISLVFFWLNSTHDIVYLFIFLLYLCLYPLVFASLHEFVFDLDLHWPLPTICICLSSCCLCSFCICFFVFLLVFSWICIWPRSALAPANHLCFVFVVALFAARWHMTIWHVWSLFASTSVYWDNHSALRGFRSLHFRKVDETALSTEPSTVLFCSENFSKRWFCTNTICF